MITTPPNDEIAKAWADLPVALTAHPGIKRLHRAALAAATASAAPAAQSPSSVPSQSVGAVPDATDAKAWEALTKERDGWRERARHLRVDLELLQAHAKQDVWVWQGDGQDHLESMGQHMAVLIMAGDLRAVARGLAAGDAGLHDAELAAPPAPAPAPRP